jgi:hypothetical protein
MQNQPTAPATQEEGARIQNRFESIVRLTRSISANMGNSLRQIDDINMQVRLLSFNAQVQAAKAGEAGRTFAVVANEIGNLSTKTASVAESLAAQTSQDIRQLSEVSEKLASEVSGNRLVDLALTNIDLIDRNLYERSCDVRWWATDASVVDALANPTPEKKSHAAKRLGVILDAYTVYFDIVLCDTNGNVIANGRSERFHSAGANISNATWFREALASSSGNQFGFQSVHASQLVSGKPILAYSCGVRENGEANGKLLGVLGILFNWESLAQTIVESTPLDAEEKTHTRACIVDRTGTVLADTRREILTGRISLEPLQSLIQERKGYRLVDGAEGPQIVALAVAPGFETYSTGWYGVIIQNTTAARKTA